MCMPLSGSETVAVTIVKARSYSSSGSVFDACSAVLRTTKSKAAATSTDTTPCRTTVGRQH